jgi:hypothetical protein
LSEPFGEKTRDCTMNRRSRSTRGCSRRGVAATWQRRAPGCG